MGKISQEKILELKTLFKKGLKIKEASEISSLNINTVNSYFIAFKQRFHSYKEYKEDLTKRRGFPSNKEYQDYLRRRKGFPSYKQYKEDLTKRRGFPSDKEYQDYLRRRKGFPSHKQYKEDLAKRRGFPSNAEYQKYLKQQHLEKSLKILPTKSLPKKHYIDKTINQQELYPLILQALEILGKTKYGTILKRTIEELYFSNKNYNQLKKIQQITLEGIHQRELIALRKLKPIAIKLGLENYID